MFADETYIFEIVSVDFCPVFRCVGCFTQTKSAVFNADDFVYGSIKVNTNSGPDVYCFIRDHFIVYVQGSRGYGPTFLSHMTVITLPWTP